MAAGRFLFGREFGESATEFDVDEDRVVAEAAGAARRKGDPALTTAFEGLSDPRPSRRVNRRSVQTPDGFPLIRFFAGRADQRDDAYKSSCPLFFRGSFQLFKQ